MMKMAFFTEMDGFNGKISRYHDNMRVEFAWMCSLNADHYFYTDTPEIYYDVVLVLSSKTKSHLIEIEKLKSYGKVVGMLQEGPYWTFQDQDLSTQINYFNNLTTADIIYAHNDLDAVYYSGLTGHKDVRVIRSLMIEDSIKDLSNVNRSDVIIGGNFCSWYGGFDSYIVAQTLDEKIYIPSMGRKIDGEEQMPNLHHLPYMNWVEWIKKLNNFKYAIHLMRTHAAGTFALNCAYLGIPCIGYSRLDTQRLCHPDLSIEIADIKHAKELAKRLKEDNLFYEKCSSVAKRNYNNYFSEELFIKDMKEVINETN